MEGACGLIVNTDNPRIVRKIIKRSQRDKSLTAKEQFQMQKWANSVCCPANGFKKLFVPKVYESSSQSYTMDRIDDKLFLQRNDWGDVEEEIALFYTKAKNSAIYPCDFELYQQPDGRVALLDFDKFGWWDSKECTARLPWGVTWKFNV